MSQEIKSTKLNENEESIKRYIDYCLSEVTISGLNILTQNGGYIYTYDKTLLTENIQVAYHFYNDTQIGPSRFYMKNELSRFIESSLIYCVSNIDERGFDLRFGKPKADIDILGDIIIVDLDFDVRLMGLDSETTFKRFTYEAPVKLGKMLEIKDDLIDDLKDDGNIDLEEFIDDEFGIALLIINENDFVYSIVEYSDNRENYRFTFNIALNLPEFQDPYLHMGYIPDLTAYVDEEFNFKINVINFANTVLEFEDDTVLFDINRRFGEITFTPTEFDIGNYTINIGVSNVYYEAEKGFNLEVKER